MTLPMLDDSLYTLVVETATNLPADVRAALARARDMEAPGTQTSLALQTIYQNIDMAADTALPICQDTGMPSFFVHTPVGADQLEIKAAIRRAVARATQDGKLRPNSVDSLTGANSGDNLGPGTPVIHFDQWERPEIEIKLILKGGGSENKSIQYSLPMELPELGKANRDLDGVRKCLLHAVHQAQGQGCSTGFLGVAIGGDRASGFETAKHQLLRPLDDTNPDPRLAELEAYVMEKANTLGIGPMGFGGGATVLGCKIGVRNRLPASFFVTVAYSCWAFRRLGVVLDPGTGAIRSWQHRVSASDAAKMAELLGAAVATGDQVVLQAPITEAQVRALKVGDVVIFRGAMHTGRDALHKYLMDHEPPVSMQGSVLYHCGPVVKKHADGSYGIVAAGPTTSIREEPYEHEVIRRYGVRAIVGKGGMGAKTLAALQEHGAVYLNAIGGAGQVYAACIKRVSGVDLLEFGVPEAMWHLEVEDFPAIVTMDARGHSLHQDVEATSAAQLRSLAEPVF